MGITLLPATDDESLRIQPFTIAHLEAWLSSYRYCSVIVKSRLTLRGVINVEELLWVARALDLRDGHPLSYSASRGADLEISQSCIYCITQDRAGQLSYAHAYVASTQLPLTHRDKRASSRPIFKHQCIICILYAWSARYRLVDIRERIIGSGTPFRSLAIIPIYISICVSNGARSSDVITCARARAIPRLDLIFVKKSAAGACGWTALSSFPRVSPIIDFYIGLFILQIIQTTIFRAVPTHR